MDDHVDLVADPEPYAGPETHFRELFIYIYGKDELVTGSKSTEEMIYRIITPFVA